MDTRLINADGSIPTDEQAFYAGQNAFATVTPDTRRLRVETAPAQHATAPSNAAIGSAADPFTLTAGQRGFIRNLGTNALFVKLGTGASTTDFHDVLAAGSANDDGRGAAIVIDDYTGPVTVAGTSPRYIAWAR